VNDVVRAAARPRAAEVTSVALLTAVFLAWSMHRIRHPGLHSDELLFATPALQAGGATYDPWLHLPLMVGGYLGALKAYLFMPVFAVAAPGPVVIRVPSVLLAGLALLGFWLFVRRTGGPAAALFTLALIVLDPSYTFAARVDWGPTVLMQVLKAAALLLLLQLVDLGRVARLWLLALVSLLGLYDKLNFIWAMNALAVAAVVAHGRRLLELARAQPRRFWPPVVVLALGTAALFVGAILALLPETHPQQAGMSGLQRVAFTLGLVARTFDGSLIHDWIVLQPMGTWPVALALHALLGIASGVVLASRRGPWSADDARLARWLVFCVVAEVAVVAQQAATRAVWGAHHILVLWPFPQAAAALAVALAVRRTRQAPALRRGLLAAAAAAAVVVVAGQARAAAAYERGIYRVARTANPLFTPEIYDLARFVGPRLPRVASVVTADWGLRYPLRTLAPAGQRDKIRDFWAVFREYGRGDGRYLYKEWFEGRSVMVVSYLPERRVFADSDNNWRRFQEKHLQPKAALRRTALGSYEIVCVAPDAASADALCGSSPLP
jgi:hypothetical protein